MSNLTQGHDLVSIDHALQKCIARGTSLTQVTAQKGISISQAATMQPTNLCHMTVRFAGSDALSDPASGELECELVLGESVSRPSFALPAWL